MTNVCMYACSLGYMYVRVSVYVTTHEIVIRRAVATIGRTQLSFVARFNG